MTLTIHAQRLTDPCCKSIGEGLAKALLDHGHIANGDETSLSIMATHHADTLTVTISFMVRSKARSETAG